MRRYITVTALVLTTLLSASAQGRLFRWGPKAGVNISTLSDTRYNTKTDYKAGLTAGLVFEFRPIKWISASAEILYSNTGAKLGSVENRFASATYNMHYLDIPLMANFYIYKGLALSTGIQVSPLLGANIVSKNAKNEKQIDDCRSDFRSTSVSIPVSISYNFNFGLYIDARYNIGLTNLSNSYSAGGVNTRDITIHSSGLVVSAGWKF